MKLTSEKDALVVDLPGRTFKVILDDEILGSKQMSFGVAVIPEGSGLPWHIHEGSDEIIYVLQGMGAAESREVTNSIDQGTVLLMESGSEHRILNQGKGEMKLLCSFSPPVKIRSPK